MYRSHASRLVTLVISFCIQFRFGESAADDSIDITHGDLRETVGEKKLCDGNSGTSGTIYNNSAVFFFLAGYFQGVDDAGQNNDGGSVLVIVEYRDIKKFF